MHAMNCSAKKQWFIVDDSLTMAPTLYVAAGVSVWL